MRTNHYILTWVSRWKKNKKKTLIHNAMTNEVSQCLDAGLSQVKKRAVLYSTERLTKFEKDGNSKSIDKLEESTLLPDMQPSNDSLETRWRRVPSELVSKLLRFSGSGSGQIFSEVGYIQVREFSHVQWVTGTCGTNSGW